MWRTGLAPEWTKVQLLCRHGEITNFYYYYCIIILSRFPTVRKHVLSENCRNRFWTSVFRGFWLMEYQTYLIQLNLYEVNNPRKQANFCGLTSFRMKIEVKRNQVRLRYLSEILSETLSEKKKDCIVAVPSELSAYSILNRRQTDISCYNHKFHKLKNAHA